MSNARWYELIKRPLVTEKATSMAAFQQYVFEVQPDANKIELGKAFEQAFPGRQVVSVRTIKMYPHQKKVGRKMGYTSVGKKAVFTVQGEPIEMFTGA
jgi:large subunit ribosomal protein L23